MLLASTPVLLAATPPPAGGVAAAAPPAPAALVLPGSDLVVLAAVAAVAVVCVVLGLVFRARALAGDDPTEAGADGLAAAGPRALVVALVVVALAAALWALPGGSVLPRGQVLTAGVELRAVRSGVLLGGAAIAALVVRLAARLPEAAAARAAAAVLADRTTGRESAVRLLSRAGGALGLVTVGLGLSSTCAVLLVAGATDHVAAAPQALLALALGAAVVALAHVRTGAPAALLPVLVALLAAGPLLGGQAIGARGLVLPLLAPGIGALFSLVGVALVSVREDEGVQAAVDRGLVIPTVLTAGFALVAVFAYLPATYGAPLTLSADVQAMLALSPAVSNPRLAVGGAVLVGALVAAVALARRARGHAAGPLAVLCLAVLALTLLSNGVVTLGLFLVAVAGTALVSSAGAVLTASAFGAVRRDVGAGGTDRVRGVARALLGELAEVGATARARTVALTAVASVVAGVALVGALFAAASAAITVAATSITVQPGPLLVAAVVDYRSFSPLVLVGILAGAATAAAVRAAPVGPGRGGTLAPALLALSVPVAVGIALGVTALLGLVVGTALVAALGALLGAPAADPAEPAGTADPTGAADGSLGGADRRSTRPLEAAGPLLVVVALVAVLITPEVVALLVGPTADGLLRLSVAGLALVVARRLPDPAEAVLERAPRRGRRRPRAGQRSRRRCGRPRARARPRRRRAGRPGRPHRPRRRPGGAPARLPVTPTPSSPPPPAAGPGDALLDALRADLSGSGWTVDAVRAALGAVAADALDRDQTVPARRALAGRTDALAVLTALFVLASPRAPATARADLDAALPRTTTAGMIALGLVAEADGGVRPLVDLRPWAVGEEHAGWLASDLGEGALGGPVPTDHVLGVGGASTTLARLTPRTPVGRALDVGTGSGVQALLAARHADAVTATDTSGRALAFAAFNAALAGVDLDLRRGDLYEPVAGERFDLVVSNPPFVITPRAPAGPATGRAPSPGVPRWTYRDGGRTGDDVVRAMVVGAAGVLAPGGVAVMLGDWEHRAAQPWRSRVGGWLEQTGLDGWVVQREVADPAEYAATWVRDGGQVPGPAADAMVAAWLDDFAAREVEAVGFGHVVLHAPRSPRAPWRRLEELTGPAAGPLGDHVAAVLAARETLAGLDDDALAATRPVVAPDVTEERHHVPGEAGPRALLLRQGGGYGRTVAASPALAGLVGVCDGSLSVGQAVVALAQILQVDPDALRAELLPQVRDLVADAFLHLAGAPGR